MKQIQNLRGNKVDGRSVLLQRMEDYIDIGIDIELKKLLDSRLLIQAGSGGGKSYLLRKIIEMIGSKYQQIIIDPEGEFVTLREKFNFALVGKGGDIPLSVKYAETLAQKILETNLSVIIDLYELKHHERILFVKRFLDAMINAPMELWHSCFVYVDECHLFCPEGSKSESAAAVIDLCTRGRKRGYAAILATQRISKISKDASAECFNKMIGATGQDIDRKRAGDELGFTSKDDVLKLRQLQPGEFYAFGPAISNEVIKFKVGKVITTHLQSGKRMVTAPPTPKAIEKILSKLSSIPDDAEKELNTKQQLTAEVTRLRTELTKATKAVPVSTPDQSEKNKQLINDFTNANRQLTREVRDKDLIITKKDKTINWIVNQLRAVVVNVEEKQSNASENITVQLEKPVINSNDAVTRYLKEQRPVQAVPVKSSKPQPPFIDTGKPTSLGKCGTAIIKLLAAYSDRPFTKSQIATITGYSINSGSFKNSLANLNSRNFITRIGDRITVNEQRINDIVQETGPIERKAFDIESFKGVLNKCEKSIYEILVADPTSPYSKELLAEMSGYSVTSGSFKNSLAKLNSLELVKRQSDGIKLNPELAELLKG